MINIGRNIFSGNLWRWQTHGLCSFKTLDGAWVKLFPDFKSLFGSSNVEGIWPLVGWCDPNGWWWQGGFRNLKISFNVMSLFSLLSLLNMWSKPIKERLSVHSICEQSPGEMRGKSPRGLSIRSRRQSWASPATLMCFYSLAGNWSTHSQGTPGSTGSCSCVPGNVLANWGRQEWACHFHPPWQHWTLFVSAFSHPPLLHTLYAAAQAA